MDGGQEGLYLYCLARSDSVPAIGGEGIDPTPPLFVHEFGGIAAVLSRVSLKDFCGESGDEKFKDLSWVGPRALRHEAVIEQVMARSPVIPARFGTIFSSRESLGELVRRNEDVITGFFDEAADKAEWAVKGILDRALAKQAASSALLEKEAVRISSLPPGRRYFEEKRLTSKAEAALRDWLKEASQAVCGGLMPHVSRFCERKVLGRTDNDDREVVLNWAFLVPEASLARFKEQVRQANGLYEAKGLAFELSGPWPPYSFSPSLEVGSAE